MQHFIIKGGFPNELIILLFVVIMILSYENMITTNDKMSYLVSISIGSPPMGASIYHVVRGGGRGVHEMTMNDHEGEGEGFRNDHVVRWIAFFLDQKTAA